MSTLAEWEKEANARAKEYADSIRNGSQHLIDQITQSKTNNLTNLQKQQENAIYNLNTQKSDINSTAEENARQLDVARMLALKSNQQSLNRAGLGTQGLVGSQVNSINNNYNSNVSQVLTDKAKALRDLAINKNDTNLTYDTNKLNLETEYGEKLADTQSSIDDKALNQYNNIYSDVLTRKQQEYQNEQNEIDRQEEIRQYNEKLAYQKEQDAIAAQEAVRQFNENLAYKKRQDEIAKQQWAKEYALKKTQADNKAKLSNLFNDDTTVISNDSPNKLYNALNDFFNTWLNHANHPLTEAEKDTWAIDIAKGTQAGTLTEAQAEELFKKIGR